MTVFKGFLILVKRNLSIFFLYLTIFVIICVSIERLTDSEGASSFQEESLEIAVINNDGGVLAEGLADYLGEKHVLVDIENTKEAIQENLFYRNVYYVVTIPEKFEEMCLDGEEKLQTTRLPGAATTFYVDRQIDTFLNDVRILKAAGFTTEEAVLEVKEIGKSQSEVTLLDKNGYGGETASHAFVFQFMPYIIISVLCYVLGFIMIDYRRREIRQRIQCSKVTLRQQNIQIVAAYLVIGIVFWLVCMLLPTIMYGKEFLSDPNKGYYMLNAFVMVLVALAIAFAIGVLLKQVEAVNGVVNVVSLGMSFLCGIFVPMSLLGDGVRTFAHFLPAYWYVQVVEIVSNNLTFTDAQRAQIWQAMGIQLLFAATILTVGLAASKYKQQD